jgi:hypothetical protein
VPPPPLDSLVSHPSITHKNYRTTLLWKHKSQRINHLYSIASKILHQSVNLSLVQTYLPHLTRRLSLFNALRTANKALILFHILRPLVVVCPAICKSYICLHFTFFIYFFIYFIFFTSTNFGSTQNVSYLKLPLPHSIL